MLDELILVCCPKPFDIYEFNLVQTNAIVSWLSLDYKKANIGRLVVVIAGNESGTAEFVSQQRSRFGSDRIMWEPNVRCNAQSTPLVPSIFAQGYRHVREPDSCLVAYVNSDIILMDTFVQCVSQAWSLCQAQTSEKEILMIGRRWDWDRVKVIDFESDNTNEQLDMIVNDREQGQDHGPGGIDYFVHTPKAFPIVPDFAIGRFFFDVWLVGNAYRRGAVVIDMSKAVKVIHQNSMWYQADSTLPATAEQRQKMYQTPEVKQNHSFDQYHRNINNGSTHVLDWATERQQSLVLRKKPEKSTRETRRGATAWIPLL